MSRRLLAFPLVLGVLAAACSAPPRATVSFGSGKQFVPQVADFLGNTGVEPAVAVTADGTPYVVSFGFLEQLEEGQTAPTRPIGYPSVPNVGLVSVKDGIWIHGAVAMQDNIANVNVPSNPAAVAELKTMTAQNANGTAIAVDSQGHLHVVWAADTGVWYADDSSGNFTAAQVQKMDPPLTEAGPLGAPSVAVMSDGRPWVAYTVATDTGLEVTAATPVNGKWQTQTVATIPFCQGCSQPQRTAVGVLGDGTPLVVYSDGQNVHAATMAKRGWEDTTVDQLDEAGADGAGISLAVDSNGDPHVAYYAGSSIHAAHSTGGGPWQVVKVADIGTGDDMTGRSTGVAVVDPTTVYVTWYDPGTGSVQLALGDGSYTAVPISGTAGGRSPSIAATPDGATVYLAWRDEANQNLDLGAYGDVSGLAIANPSPVPTGAPSVAPPPSAECEVAKRGEVTVVAQGVAFVTNCIQVPADQPFTIHFDNRDPATVGQHNIAIFQSAADLTAALFRGDLVTGPATMDYRVDALKTGEYFFHCDVHPTMTGKVIAK